MQDPRLGRLWAVVAVGVVALSGCAPGVAGRAHPAAVLVHSRSVPPTEMALSPAAPATTSAPAPAPAVSVVAQAVVSRLGVYDDPTSPSPSRTLVNPQPSGAPLVLLVRSVRDGWLDVLLPVRPNGATGWIRRSDVALSHHDFRIVVELGAHRITVYRGEAVFLQEPIGVGTDQTPTPGGLYYTTELIEPVTSGRYDPDGPYGPYAYGLSGFSDVLTSFGDGDGELAIHGTDDPAGLGHDVSHGCIRMSNAGISTLARALPLGVPVDVRP